MKQAAPPPRVKAFSLTTKCGARGRAAAPRAGAARRLGLVVERARRSSSRAVAPREAVGERERCRARRGPPCRAGRAAACPARRAAVAEREHRRSPGVAPRACPPREPARAPPHAATIKAHATPPLADRDDDPNYNAYVIQAAAFFMIAALGLVWTVCACYECKKFTDCCCPNPECGPCACVECLPGFRPGAAGDSKKTDGAGAVEMTEEV